MSKVSPWDEILVPGSDFNVKQIAGKMAVPCYWGRDPSGACLFIMELKGDLFAEFQKNNVRVNGLGVELRQNSSILRLILSLEKRADRDIFEGLCRSLANALEVANDSASSMAVAFAHLRRWKAFMAGRKQLMSAEEIRGLFAELCFLRELIQHLGADEALKAWMGPERSHQDFIFGNTAVEIKSLSGAERNSVRISSEDQLESLNEHLFLRTYKLSNLPDASSAQSLNQIILCIQEVLDSAEAIEAFDSKLAEHFYTPHPEYDDPMFVVSVVKSYRVDGDFPRLIRSKTPTSINKISYDINLESISIFECDKLWEGE
ncbi:PD-(D/E)XK motif protein [Methylophilus sp.]|uniref:PD-(D/E)XK motif protein n=1 Tax=Methylophilus sp. TaxID=29541 RepID=UPI0011D68061|nr:PD-(D/E)XK motif protein [Methylophilus sp.]TXI47156.1 MAG: PD-(D/E)XK motif protein [Methylophilus sp.]